MHISYPIFLTNETGQWFYLISAHYLGTAWKWNGGCSWGQKERLKQTSCLSHFYLFGVQTPSIIVLPLCIVSQLVGYSHISQLLLCIPLLMIDVSWEAPQGGAKWSYSIFPIMSRRRSLTLMLSAMLPPAQPVLYMTKARGWSEWNKSSLLISRCHLFFL